MGSDRYRGRVAFVGGAELCSVTGRRAPFSTQPTSRIHMIPKLRLNPSTVRHGFGLSLGCLAALVLGACQTDSPAPSNPTEVEASIALKDAWKAPDQVTWRTTGESRTAVLSGSGTSYTARISLAGPLQTGTSVWLALWTAGMRTAEIRYVQQDGRRDLKQEEVVPDPVAMALLAKIPFPEQRNPDSLASVYAKVLVDGDTAFKGFPENCPVGIDTSRLIEVALVYAVSKKQKLSTLAATWSLAIDTADVHVRIRALAEAGRVNGSDTLGMFPPPPVRVAAPLAVSGAVEAGGDLVDVAGRFDWDADLGQITVDAQLTREGRRIETVALSGLSIGSGERFLLLTGKARLLAGSAAPVGICSLAVVVRSERGDSARSAVAFEVKAASAPPQAPVIELVSPSEGSSFPFDSARIEVVWKVKSARSPVDTVFVADSLATKLTDSTWRAWVRLPATGRSSLVAVRARNAQGLWGTGSANFTRAKDQAAPDLVWLASGEDTAVESDVTFFVARLRAADASGIASVAFGEQAPDSVLAGGVYAKRIELGAPGTSVTIFVAVTDSAGNRTEASRKVVRKASNSLEIYGLPDTLRVWEDSVLEHAIQVNCPTGSTCMVTAKVSDTTLTQVSVAGTTTAPAIRIMPRSDRNGAVDLDVELSTGTRKASAIARLVVKPVNDAPSLSVKVSAMASPMGEVRITDWLVSSLVGPSDESGQKLRYTVAADSAASLLSGAPAMDAGALVFSPKGISGTVRFSIVALDDGDSVSPSVHKSTPQTLRVKLDAPPTLRVRDTLIGYEDQRTGLDTIRIDDLENPAELNLDWTVLDSALLPRANLRVKSVPGGYSYDALGAPDSNGLARIAWTLTDPAGNVVKDTTAVRIVPVNDAPVITKAPGMPDTILVSCLARDTTLPKVFGEIQWEPGASTQTGSFSMELVDSAQSHFFRIATGVDGILPLPDGRLRLVVQVDTEAVVGIRVRAQDNGGTTNGGADTGERLMWLHLTDTVMDVDGNAYRYKRMPDWNVWLLSNLYTKPRNGDTAYRCAGGDLWNVGGDSKLEPDCAKRGALYHWGTALNQPLGCDTSMSCYLNIPTKPQGLCPKGWHVADREEWSLLMRSTYSAPTAGGAVDSTVNLRSATHDWGSKYSGWMEFPGTGKFGDFIVPTDHPHGCQDRSAGSTNGTNFWLPHRPAGWTPSYPVPGGITFTLSMTSVRSDGICGVTDPGVASVRCVRD